MLFIIIIIIIIIVFYFENVTFFHAKLGSGVFPRVDNQTSGNTLQDLTRPLVEKSPSASYPPMGIGASFWWWDALPHQPVKCYYHLNVYFIPRSIMGLDGCFPTANY